jgi:arylsulfatase A-like enzyme
MTERTTRLARSAAGLLPALPLFAVFAVVMLVSTPASYSLRDASVLLAVYALLSAALGWQAALIARVLPWLWWLAGLPAALALAFHLRESLSFPHSKLEIAAFSASACIALSWLARGPSRTVSPLRALSFAAAFGAAALALLVLAFQTWNNLRWHVLEHNGLLGIPMYYATATPTREVVDDLWSQPRTRAPVEPPRFIAGPRQGPPPNILFVLVDTLRADRLTAYGGAPERMPNTNALASGAAVFTDVLANASWTRPSVASMFTGLLQEQHGAVDRQDALRPSVTTLAEHLSASGYETVGLVTNFGAVGVAAGFAQGFDELIELTWDQEAQRSPHVFMPAEHVNGHVEGWLSQRTQRDKPLFLYVHYLDPHDPWVIEPPKSPLHADQMKAYDVHVSHFDRHLKPMLESVRAALGAEPVIVLTSDHGEEFGEHGASGHGSSLSREQLHIPLLVALPQGAAQSLPARLEGRDIFSLVGYLAGGGRDLVQWSKAHARSERYASVFLSTTMSLLEPRLQLVGMRAYDDGQHLLRWSAFGQTYELYDLARDADTRVNLFEERPAQARALMQPLARPIESGVDTMVPGEVDVQAHQALRALGYVD